VAERVVNLGLIGGGLMGRELASAAARWIHLENLGVRPRLVHACDVQPEALAWYERLADAPTLSSDPRAVFDDPQVEALYIAVPHNLHAELYVAALEAGKHLFGEKPFGIDLDANEAIMRAVAAHPDLLVRCSSEMPFFPGGQEVWRWISQGSFGRPIEVRSLFLHSSDLDPNKPINWKRRAETNGAYGSLGDLGMHALHLPLRAGWAPVDVRAVLSDVVKTRPDAEGNPVPADTPDNAVLLCRARHDGDELPLRIETKRIAPGETNTWTIEVDGTGGSIAFTTKRPKTLRKMRYSPGGRQSWEETDLGSQSAYPSITGAIFEFGFSDAVQQMWAAFLDELAHGREGMRQPFFCATPDEAAFTHDLFTAALSAHERRAVELVEPRYPLAPPRP
jgi:predicted dehydrogenase